MALLGLGAAAAQAQSADDVVQVVTTDPGNVAEAVAGFCRQSDEAEREVQIGVGAAFAQSYLYFVSVGDQPSAGLIAQIACTCEQTPGDILSSYLATLGEAEDQACSSTWSADRSVSLPSVFLSSAGGVPPSPN